MGTIRGKGSTVMMALLLVSGGVAAGMLGSSLTSSAVSFQRASFFPATERVAGITVDQVSAGQSWARSAFPGGLRRCPAMNESFLAACEAEMKALSARPELPYGSYGRPLLVTKIEPAPPAPEEQTTEAELSEPSPISYDVASPEVVARHLPVEADANYPAIADDR